MLTFFDCAWNLSLLAITVYGLLADGAHNAYLPALSVFNENVKPLPVAWT